MADQDAYKHSICNKAATPLRVIFGAQDRVSADGPLPVWAARLLQKTVTDYKFILFLRAIPANLPCPSASDNPPVQLEPDPQGALEGQVIFLSMGKLSQTPEIEHEIREIELCGREARSPLKSLSECSHYLSQAEAAADRLWAHLKQTFAAGNPTPAFGKATVWLNRAGECHITMDEKDSFTTRDAKLAQRQLIDGMEIDTRPLSQSCEIAARHVFNFVRDLGHKHYHHDNKSDLLTTAYPHSAADDQTWRRETLYGLMRLVILARRRGNARQFRNVLGLIAYAEAFQRHLATWHIDGDAIKAMSPTFQYDMGALRQSVDASAKIRDLSDQEKRQSFLFISSFIVAMFAALLSALKAVTPANESGEFEKTLLYPPLKWLTHAPTLALTLAFVAAWLLDMAFLRQSFRPWFLQGWNTGLSRALDAAMGTFMRRGVRPWTATILAISIAILIIVSTALIAIFSGWASVSYLQR